MESILDTRSKGGCDPHLVKVNESRTVLKQEKIIGNTCSLGLKENNEGKIIALTWFRNEDAEKSDQDIKQPI